MKTIAVLGVGAMGSGIVQTLAEAGYGVIAADEAFANYPAFLLATKEKILQGIFARKDADGKFVCRTREAVYKIFNRIQWQKMDSPEFKSALGLCGAAIEAIAEDMTKKKELYALLEKFLGKETPIFTNTSVIKIKTLAGSLKHKERFMGVHFFNPVPLMKPVELIAHENTSPATKEIAEKIVKDLGKEPCAAPDMVGFISNGCFVPLIMAAAEEYKNGADYKKIDKAFTTGAWADFPPAKKLVELLIANAENILAEGKATEAEIDKIIRLGFNMPYGPFEIKKMLAEGRAKEVKFPVGPFMLCDHVGLDVALDCCKMFKSQEPEKWQVPEILAKMVSEGKKGKKGGSGFYEYKKKATFEVAPDKSFARIGWTGKVLTLEIVKSLGEYFGLAKILGVESIILEINRGRGADINEFLLPLLSREAANYAINVWHTAICAAIYFPGPVIAAIKGSAFGGAYEWALACDYIVSEKKAKIGLVELQRGIMPGGGGTQTLTRRVGLFMAERMILRGATIEELGDEIGPPWVDEAVEKITEEKLMELAAKRKTIQKRNRDSLQFSLWDKFQELREAKAAGKHWGRAQKCRPPASFELARNAIWHGNQKPIFSGLCKDEFDAILKAFETDDAFNSIIDFFESKTKKTNFKKDEEDE